MLIIEPVKQFLVERHLNNPSDTGTYYCKAVITNSLSGVVIDTFNLTDNGGKYFSKSWVTPNDPSGTGLQITISTTVYDDSGYTTESVVYGTDKTSYIVRALAGTRLFGGYAGPGGRTGGEVDYNRIQKMINDAVKQIVIPEQKEYDDSEVRKGVASTHVSLAEIIQEGLLNITQEIKSAIKEIDKSDEVIEKILSSKEINAIKDLPRQFEKAEMSDEELHATIDEFLKNQEKKNSEFKDGLKKILTEMSTNMEEFNDKAEEVMGRPVNVVFNSRPEGDKRQKIKEQDVDEKRMGSINQLLNGY